MTPSELKARVDATGSYYFDRASMKFFGDTMRNYGVRSAFIRVQYDQDDHYISEGMVIEVWELYRKRPVRHNNQASAYFDKITFERRHPAYN